MNILFIGGGNMGAAIAAGAMANIAGLQLVVVDPDVERARSLLEDDRVVFHANFDALRDSQFDLTVLAIKPQHFSTLSATALSIMARGAVVSIMAGVSLETMRAKIGSPRVIRTMPNLPALVGRAMTVGFATSEISEVDLSLIESVFNGVGTFAWLDAEEKIDSATAVAGSGPGYVFAFAQHLIEGAKAIGIDEHLADQMVRQTIAGAAAMLLHDDRTASELKEAVTSKGGTTQAGLAVFEAENALPQICARGIAAAKARASELSKI